jgi:hypothetical protein
MNKPICTPTGPLKPGFRTTEFWLTLGTFLVSGFVLTGVIAQGNQDTVGQIVTHAITSVGLVAGQAAIVYKYISGRNKKKVAAAVAKAKTKDIDDNNRLPTKPKPRTRVNKDKLKTKPTSEGTIKKRKRKTP